MKISRITSDLSFRSDPSYWFRSEHRMMGSKQDIDFWCDRLKLNIPYFENLITRCVNKKSFPRKRLYWILDHMIVANPAFARMYYKELLSIFLHCGEMGIIRSITRAILSNHAIYLNQPYFLDKCAKLSIDKSVPVAVRCNALSLFTLGVVEMPELLGELEWMLELISEENTPSLNARVKKSFLLLKKSSIK
ncbi:hypothetical protein OAT16_02890 [Prolixibacteraceae bacterium]|nr:hypothetical protein [Prolixibacteraceae bacterium]